MVDGSLQDCANASKRLLLEIPGLERAGRGKAVADSRLPERDRGEEPFTPAPLLVDVKKPFEENTRKRTPFITKAFPLKNNKEVARQRLALAFDNDDADYPANLASRNFFKISLLRSIRLGLSPALDMKRVLIPLEKLFDRSRAVALFNIDGIARVNTGRRIAEQHKALSDAFRLHACPYGQHGKKIRIVRMVDRERYT